MDGNGCLARDETAYLSHRHELVHLAPVVDSAVLQLETWVEDRLIRYWRSFRNVRRPWTPVLGVCLADKEQGRSYDLSADPNVYIYRGQLIRRIAKALLFFMITLLLMMPVVICNLIETISARIIVVMLSTVSYLLILSWLTKSRTMELILAGAT